MQKEKTKTELKIGIENFGPISSGEIRLKPLTIFIGPNNSGKSYAAMLIRSLFESYSYGPSIFSKEPHRFSRFISRRFAPIDIRIFSKEFPELKRQVEDFKEGEELEIPKQSIDKLTNMIFEAYVKRLNDEIVRSFACRLNDLIRIGKSSFALRINFDSYNAHLIYQKGKLKTKEYPQLDMKIKVKGTKGYGPSIEIEEKEKEVLIKIDAPRRKEKDRKEFMFFGVMDVIVSLCMSRIFENVGMPCYYLPAARSGILQAHKALAASIVRKSPYVGIESLEVPKLSGTVSDFISSVIILPEEKGPFYKLAQNFEKELIKGEILVRSLDENLYPEIRYGFQKTEIPLHRSSSTVSELAPLFLYLKYSIRSKSTLIIEEPEAHLHPENQRTLAKFLVKLIRKGVNIVITTHSEFLLEQLNSFILLSKIEPKKRSEQYKYSEEDFLNPDEVAAYVFRYDTISVGHKILGVEITEEDGISQEEFIKVHETLYEETLKLQRGLSAEERV